VKPPADLPAYVKTVIEEWEKVRLSVGEISHGTLTGRTYHLARNEANCEECAQAWRDYQRMVRGNDHLVGLPARAGRGKAGSYSLARRLGFDPEELELKGLKMCTRHKGILPISEFNSRPLARGEQRKPALRSACRFCQYVDAHQYDAKRKRRKRAVGECSDCPRPATLGERRCPGHQSKKRDELRTRRRKSASPKS